MRILKKIQGIVGEIGRDGTYRTFLFWAGMLLYLEMVYKAIVYHRVFSSATVYTALFSLLAALGLFLLTSLFSKRVNFILSIVLTSVIVLFFSTQLIYSRVFDNPLSLSFVELANQGFDYYDIILQTMWANWYGLLLFILPIVFVCVFGRRLVRYERSQRLVRITAGGCAAGLYGLCLLSLPLSGHSESSAFSLYYQLNIPRSTQEEFGVLTGFRLDAQRALFGFKESYSVGEEPGLIGPGATYKPVGGQTVPSGGTTDPSQPPAPIEYGYNVMDIDFDKLIASAPNKEIKELHEYFQKVAPTQKNQYTGMFEGDNLIMITAESFSPYAIHEKYTPTLYKLAKESIQFNNFYNVSWGNSTTDGEYAACFGLIPSGAGRSPEKSANNYLPFCMGNQFRKLPGYGETFAYHNHSYYYYGRDLSHPNMGYTYKGLGAGLDITATWPESDDEMMEAALPDFINQDQFHAYFMTVSGHQAYTFGNAMARKHKDKVADLEGVLPEACRAYIACNIELDLMLERLLTALEEAGKLDNTVIVISADHYPYALRKDGSTDLDALAGHKLEETFEINKSTLIIWKNNLERIVVDKPVASVDIIPTVSNLFGLEYDSRLLMGRDALSDADGLVIFDMRHWLTDQCAYHPKQGVMFNYTDVQYSSDDSYVKGIRATVDNRIKYSRWMLEQDYYAYVFGVK